MDEWWSKVNDGQSNVLCSRFSNICMTKVGIGLSGPPLTGQEDLKGGGCTKDSACTTPGLWECRNGQWDCRGIPEPGKGPQGMEPMDKPSPQEMTRDTAHSKRLYGRVGVAWDSTTAQSLSCWERQWQRLWEGWSSKAPPQAPGATAHPPTSSLESAGPAQSRQCSPALCGDFLSPLLF